jgi:hypothetical protein
MVQKLRGVARLTADLVLAVQGFPSLGDTLDRPVVRCVIWRRSRWRCATPPSLEPWVLLGSAGAQLTEFRLDASLRRGKTILRR